MDRDSIISTKGCLILVAIVLAIPLFILGGVGVKTWLPLREAKETLTELDRSLGDGAAYIPTPSGAIPAERMELFVELRAVMVAACADYGEVQEGFDSVAELETKDQGDPAEVRDVAVDLGGAALAITPFLARFFVLRNEALLEASMGLEEYCYIFAIAYRDHLLSASTRGEIFSDGEALSPDASLRLQACLAQQREQAPPSLTADLDVEMRAMAADPTRLIWQEGSPDGVEASVRPFRNRLDTLFCAATAGLEMERDPGRALWVAIE